jgi:hypothetical protein
MRTKALVRVLISTFIMATAAACASGPAQPSSSESNVKPRAPNPTGTGETVEKAIDNSTGGTVELSDGTQIDVPPGALPPGVEKITVTSSPEPAPSDYVAFSPVYEFGPEGTVFLKPLVVSIPSTLPASTDRTKITVLWSRMRGDGFDMVPTEVGDGEKGLVAQGEVTHFSQGLVGEKFVTDPRPTADPYED